MNSTFAHPSYKERPASKAAKFLLFVILTLLSAGTLRAQFTPGPQPGLPDRGAVHTATDAIDLFDARPIPVNTAFNEGTAGAALIGTQPATDVPSSSWVAVGGTMSTPPTFVSGGGMTWNNNTAASMLINLGNFGGTTTFSNVQGTVAGYSLLVLSDATAQNCIFLNVGNTSVSISKIVSGIPTVLATPSIVRTSSDTWTFTVRGQSLTVFQNGASISTVTLPTGSIPTNTWAGINDTYGGFARMQSFSYALDRPCTGALGTGGNCIPLTGGSETVAYSATPTFSTSTRVSVLTLAGNVSTFTLASGVDGQEKTLFFCQNGTGGYTVAAPSNVRGFLPNVGTVANKCNGQHLIYIAPLSAWMSDDAEINQ